MSTKTIETTVVFDIFWQCISLICWKEEWNKRQQPQSAVRWRAGQSAHLQLLIQETNSFHRSTSQSRVMGGIKIRSWSPTERWKRAKYFLTLPTVTCSIKPHLLSPPISIGVTRSTRTEILQITTLNRTKQRNTGWIADTSNVVVTCLPSGLCVCGRLTL